MAVEPENQDGLVNYYLTVYCSKQIKSVKSIKTINTLIWLMSVFQSFNVTV